MKIIRLFLIVTLFGVPSPTTAAPDGALERIEIQSDQMDRTYLMYVPTDVQAQTTLVVMIHGGGGSAEQAARDYGWNELADRKGFIVIYPDALQRTWNAGDCCGRAVEQGVDDIGFLQDAISDARVRAPVPIEHVAITGISNGGMLAYRYACSIGDIDAIGVVAATLVSDCAHPSPMSVMHVHGLADTRVPMDGSVGDGQENVSGWPVNKLMELWQDVNECHEPVDTSTGGVHVSVATCPNDRRVILVTIEEVGHDWPGARRAESTDYETTMELWSFFSNLPDSRDQACRCR